MSTCGYAYTLLFLVFMVNSNQLHFYAVTLSYSSRPLYACLTILYHHLVLIIFSWSASSSYVTPQFRNLHFRYFNNSMDQPRRTNPLWVYISLALDVFYFSPTPSSLWNPVYALYCIVHIMYTNNQTDVYRARSLIPKTTYPAERGLGNRLDS